MLFNIVGDTSRQKLVARKTKDEGKLEKLIVKKTKTKDECRKKLQVSSKGVAPTVPEKFGKLLEKFGKCHESLVNYWKSLVN